MTTVQKNKVAVAVVGRFMLPHNAHFALIRKAIASLRVELEEGTASEGKVYIILGSAYHARTPKNPFSASERTSMIQAGLTPEERDMVSFLAVRDYHDDDRWARVVNRKMTEAVGADTRVKVVGHLKDASSSYLNDCFPTWQVVQVESLGNLDATTLRAMLLTGEDNDITLSALADYVPEGVRKFLRVWMEMPCYQSLKEEFAVLRKEKQKYGIGPFVAGDSVVRTRHHVLLIKRKNHPGKGLLALPGGFLEPERRETPRQCSERELLEEANLNVLTSSLREAFMSSEVFAHPDRSVRGNVIGHTYFYYLDRESCPDVEPGDDAGEADWYPLEKLKEMESQFYDDHFLQLDTFLGILPEDE